jgi:hypothetical protein
VTRRTNSVPRDPVVRHVATVEVCIEALRACLADTDATASALTLPMLERLETSVATLAAALGEPAVESAPAPVTKKRRKADNGDGPAKSAGNVLSEPFTS